MTSPVSTFSGVALLLSLTLPLHAQAATRFITIDYDGRWISDSICGSHIGDNNRLEEGFREVKTFDDPLDPDETVIDIEANLWLHNGGAPGEIEILLNEAPFSAPVGFPQGYMSFSPVLCTPVTVEADPEAIASWRYGTENTLQLQDSGEPMFTLLNYVELVVTTEREPSQGCSLTGKPGGNSIGWTFLALLLLGTRRRHPRRASEPRSGRSSLLLLLVGFLSLSGLPAEAVAGERIVGLSWVGADDSCAPCGEQAVCSDDAATWFEGTRSFVDPLPRNVVIEEVVATVTGHGTAVPTKIYLGDQPVGDPRRFPSHFCTGPLAECTTLEFIGEGTGAPWPGYREGGENEVRVELDTSEEDARLCISDMTLTITYGDASAIGGCSVGPQSEMPAWVFALFTPAFLAGRKRRSG